MADSRYWSKELLTEFIEIYRAHPCLWKIKCKEYTNRNLKNAAYDKLIELCKVVNSEANRDYVVKKIQSFRGSFRKELKKVENSKRSGTSPDDIYIPSLWYYDQLIFTIDQEMPTESVSAIDEADEFTPEVENEESQFSEDRERKVFENEENNTQTSVTQMYTGRPAQISTPQSNNLMKSKRSKATKQSAQGIVEYCKYELGKREEIDEYDAVAISWAKKLKRMDSTQAIYTETLVNKIISQGLLKKLTTFTDVTENQQMKSSSSSSPCTYYNMSSTSSPSTQQSSVFYENDDSIENAFQ